VSRLEREREVLSDAITKSNNVIIGKLEALGFSRDTLLLLPVAPLVYVAWADGAITDYECRCIRMLASLRGVTRETPACALLESWLEKRPPESFFVGTLRLIRLLLGTLEQKQFKAATEDLVACCKRVAENSRSILGFSGGVGPHEERLLARIAAELQQDNQPAARRFVADL
jgi:hypothetical protein